MSKKRIRAFFRLAGYYHRFVPNFSELAAPLSNLTQKKQAENIKSMSECQVAFNHLKRALTSGPVLIAPDFNCEFIIYTDMSNVGLGAVLSQADVSGNVHPVMYISKKLQSGEKHLSTIAKECLAIIWTLQKLNDM